MVGILEHLEESLLVLEQFIPKYFEGVTEIYHLKNFEVNKNQLKPKVEDEIRLIIAKNISREIEFYNFCKQRLFKQYKSIYV